MSYGSLCLTLVEKNSVAKASTPIHSKWERALTAPHLCQPFELSVLFAFPYSGGCTVSLTCSFSLHFPDD